MTTYKINDYAFCTASKETVKITNGTGTSGQSDDFVPTEAIALRVIGYEKGRAITAFTYRKVNLADLRPMTPNKYGFNMPERVSKYFIGRI